METDDDSALGPDVRRQWDDMPNIYTEDNSRSGEQVSDDVEIWSVKAGALVFEVLYGSVRTASPPLSHTPSQPATGVWWVNHLLAIGHVWHFPLHSNGSCDLAVR